MMIYLYWHCFHFFIWIPTYTQKIIFFSVYKGFFCGKTLLELFVWKWIHQIRNVTLKVNFVLYPRVFRSCGYKMHTIEKIFEKINVLRNVVIRNLYFIFRLKIHGVIKISQSSSRKMTSFENFSNVSRISQGILKTVEGIYLYLKKKGTILLRSCFFQRSFFQGIFFLFLYVSKNEAKRFMKFLKINKRLFQG